MGLRSEERESHTIFVLIKAFSKSLCPLGVGGVILEATKPIRTEMFHDKIKAICQKNATVTSSGASF